MDSSIPQKVVPRQAFVFYCYILISSVLVVLITVGCLWVTSMLETTITEVLD